MQRQTWDNNWHIGLYLPSTSSVIADPAASETGPGREEAEEEEEEEEEEEASEEAPATRSFLVPQSDRDPENDQDDRCTNPALTQIDLAVEDSSPDSMDLVKLVLLGASAVGKSSIIQQFVWNEFSEDYHSTVRKETYYPSVIINDHLYELKIIDIPVIPYFPVNSLYEWTDFRFYGLRSATAYILVYDLHSLDTFQYIKTIRDQIVESRDLHSVPLLVVGNKHDLCDVRDRRDIVNLVKKQWKCGYVECSAKYNWHVVTLFKELMKTIDYIDYGQKAHSAPRLHGISGAIQRNKCIIL